MVEVDADSICRGKDYTPEQPRSAPYIATCASIEAGRTRALIEGAALLTPFRVLTRNALLVACELRFAVCLKEKRPAPEMALFLYRRVQYRRVQRCSAPIRTTYDFCSGEIVVVAAAEVEHR